MKIVKVKWQDSGSVDGLVWQFKDDWTCGVHICCSVGYLVKDDVLEVVIAQSENSDQWGRLFSIPKSSILEMKAVKL
jgi:hypothetical protein